MEELDEDDFSDLYADVEVQASSALSAMHRSTKLPQRSGNTVENATRREKKVADGFIGAQIDGGNRKLDERDATFEVVVEGMIGGGSRISPVDNGDGCVSESESENGTSMDSHSDDENELEVNENCENEKYDDRETDVEFGEIAGKEKRLNGDGGAQRKILQYNALDSQKKRVDEMPQEVRRTFKKGDTDDRDPFFIRTSEDNQLRIASERYRQACNPVTSDLDERGSVHISDSVEGSPRDVSECDPEGMSGTSDDTVRRQVNCTYNKVPPIIEPESSDSGKSQHGQHYSSSPCRDAHSSRYFKNSNKRSRYSPPRSRGELQEPVTRGNYPLKDSENSRVKRGNRDGRCHDRWRDSMRQHSNQPKKSNMFKKRLDEDAYAIEHLYNGHSNRGKQRAAVTFNYNDNDIPHCNQSGRILTYSGVRFPDHHSGPAFLKDQHSGQYWNVPNCRYTVVRPDCRNMRERQDFLDNKSSRIHYEALQYDRYHNHRRHSFRGDIKELRNLSPEYSTAVNQRSTQFLYKGDNLHHRRTRRDYLSPPHQYGNVSLEGNYKRTSPSRTGDRDHLVRSYDRNVAPDRREVESSGWDKRRRCSRLNSSENLCYIETEANDRRNIKHRQIPFCSSEEPYAPSPGGFLRASVPKSVVAQRNIRSSRKEMRIESDRYSTDFDTSVAKESVRYHPSEDYHYRQSSNTSLRESIKDDQYQDHFVGRRHQHSEVLHWREDAFESRQQENIVFGSEERSYNFERISKNDEADDRLALCRAKDLNERETVIQNSNVLREDSNELFDGYCKSTQPHSHAQIHTSHQYSVARVVIEGRKSSIRRTTGAREDTFYGRRDLEESNAIQTNSFEDSDKSNPEKTVQSDEGKVCDKKNRSKLSENQQNEFLDIEEGQIVTEGLERATKCTPTSEDVSQIIAGNGVAERLDDEKIRAIMVKMEKRRERFKESITKSQDCEKPSSPLPASNVGTAEARLGRPARKRRWL